MILSTYCVWSWQEKYGRCSLAWALSTAADAAYMHVSVFKLSGKATDIKSSIARLKYRLWHCPLYVLTSLSSSWGWEGGGGGRGGGTWGVHCSEQHLLTQECMSPNPGNWQAIVEVWSTLMVNKTDHSLDNSLCHLSEAFPFCLLFVFLPEWSPHQCSNPAPSSLGSAALTPPQHHCTSSPVQPAWHGSESSKLWCTINTT